MNTAKSSKPWATFSIGVLLGVLLTVVAGGAFLLLSKVVVFNESEHTLNHVQVSLANNIVWSGTLAPGESHSSYGFPKADGTVNVSFEVDGKVISEHFGYVTLGFTSDRHDIVVLPSLEVKYAGP